jgi:hypothetical protein
LKTRRMQSISSESMSGLEESTSHQETFGVGIGAGKFSGEVNKQRC